MGTKTVTLINIDFKSQGRIFQSRNQLNVYFENLDIDMYRNTGGIYLSIRCVYPLPIVNNLLYFNNMTIYFSQDRADGLVFANSAFLHSGDGDVVINNVKINIYSLASDFAFGLALFSSKPWNASSTDIRYFNISNVYITTFPSLVYDKTSYFTSLFWLVSGGTLGLSFVKFENITFENMQNTVIAPLLSSFDTTINVVMTNIIFRNIDSTVDLIEIDTSNSLVMSNLEVTNWSFTSSATMYFVNSLTATFKNFTLNNINAHDISINQFFKFTSVQNGMISIQNFSILNSNFSDSISVFYIDSNSGSNININNVNYSNVATSNKVSLFMLGAIPKINVNNLTFFQVYQQDSVDITNTMINLESIYSTIDSNITFTSVTVSNSTISFIKISNNYQSQNINQYITIKQFEYSNCDIRKYDSLIQTDSVFLRKNIRGYRGYIFRFFLNKIFPKIYPGIWDKVSKNNYQKKFIKLRITLL